MQRIRRFIDKFEEIVTGVLLVYIVVILTMAIGGRELFGLSWAWQEESLRIAFVYLVLIAIAMGAKYDAHIRITFFRNLFPKAVQTALLWAADIIWVIFNILAFYYSTELIATMQRFVQLTPVLELKLPYVYMILPFSLALTTVRIIQRRIITIQ
ncbi:TRAP transporter small permease, partial [Desulfovibrio sp. OttesenSCG-928-I05]|nr:TRAP transporter small permease [Desulfovibrio sp. OttesenSCG-928-I05]